MNDWKNSPITRRADGSYVIAYAGFPEYHVPNDEEFAELWAQVEAYAQEHPEQVTDEPAPAEPAAEELLERAKAAKMAELDQVMAEIDTKLIRSTGDLVTAALAPGVLTVAADGSQSSENEEIRQSMMIFSGLKYAQRWNRTQRTSVQLAKTVEEVQAVKLISAGAKIAEIMEKE